MKGIGGMRLALDLISSPIQVVSFDPLNLVISGAPGEPHQAVPHHNAARDL